MTGATFWLYRLFYFHLSGGIDKIFIKTDKKVNKLMMKAMREKNMFQGNATQSYSLVMSCKLLYEPCKLARKLLGHKCCYGYGDDDILYNV